MFVYTDLKIAHTGGTAVALGYFDGVHLGHRRVIGRAVELAQERRLTSAVFTFTMSDAHTPDAKKSALCLTTLEQKLAIFKELGVSIVICPPFAAFSGLAPEEFVDRVLVEAFGARVVTCGDNYRFGAKAAGDLALLKKLCGARGIDVEVVPPELYEGETISSTRIRACLLSGQNDAAAAMLGVDPAGLVPPQAP